MVSNVTSLTGNGLKDWLIQRTTAVYLAAYSLFLFGFLVMHPHLIYSEWQAFFSCVWVQTATIMAVLMVSLHAWIGIWTVTTDYLKPIAVRLPMQLLVALFLIGQFIWSLIIVWGR
jgi:succinate dehydrogenase / fumarate reductase membrane anchor subunit